MSNKLIIDTSLLDLNLNPSTSYTITLPEGFILQDDVFGTPNPILTFTFTTEATVPTLNSTTPSNNSTGILNIAEVVLTYSRNVFPRTGNFYLYQNGENNTDVVIKTLNVTNTNDVVFNGPNVTLKISNILSSDNTYYILSDADVIKDGAGLRAAAIINENTIRFTTADLAFPDLKASITSTAFVEAIATIDPAVKVNMSSNFMFTVGSGVFDVSALERHLSDNYSKTVFYTEDTQFYLNLPKITDTLYINEYGDVGSYTYTISTSDASSVRSFIDNSGSGATTSFNSTSKQFTITGTKAQINESLDWIRYRPGVDYVGSFTFTYAVQNPLGNTQNKTSSFAKSAGSNDTEITNINVSRTYYYKQENEIFATQTPFISDFDTNTAAIYDLSLSTPSGNFLDSDSELVSTITFSGTRTAANAWLAQVKFYPLVTGQTPGIYVTYIQNKDTLEQFNDTFYLAALGNGTIGENIYVFKNSGTFTPTVEEKLYGKIIYEMVGGGGAGGLPGSPNNSGAGGGAGQVITNYTGFAINSQTSFTISVGNGGTYPGGNGTNTVFNGITAQRGFGASATQGGTSGTNYVGTANSNSSNPPQYSGAGGGSLGDASCVNISPIGTFCTVGGAGVDSQIISPSSEYEQTNPVLLGYGGSGWAEQLFGGPPRIINAKSNEEYGCGGIGYYYGEPVTYSQSPSVNPHNGTKGIVIIKVINS